MTHVRYAPTGDEGKKCIQAMANEIRKARKGTPYDCVVGVSEGGGNSSYPLHITKKVLEVRPLAVHFSNTYNAQITEKTCKKCLKKLDV